jgi:lipopolysaccharide export LptBFGC system permease protein LptF
MELKKKYILKGFFINFAFSFLIIFFIFFINGLFQLIDLIIKGTFSIFSLLKFFILTVIISLQYVIPLSILSASISLFSTLSSDRELNIFAFSGIPHYHLFKPLIYFSIIFTLFLFYFNFFLIPEMKFEKRNIAYKIKVRNPLSLIIEKEVIKEIPDTTIYVEKIYRNFNLKNISITKKEGDLTIFLKAERGKVIYNQQSNQLIFLLENGNILNYARNTVNTINFKKYEFIINLPQNFQLPSLQPKISEINFFDLIKIKNIESSIEFHKRIIFSITPLIFLVLGYCAGSKLKHKNRVLYIGLGGLISIIFFELLIIGELFVRKFEKSIFIYLPVIVFILVIKRFWK